MFCRAAKVHKIIYYEALLRLTWKGFITWLEAHHPNQMHSVSALPYQISDAHGDMSQPEFDELLSSDSLADSLILWNMFLSYPRHDNRNLQPNHPQVYQHFSNGGLSAQLADDNPFGRIPVHQATDVTVNKDTHTVGGTTK